MVEPSKGQVESRRLPIKIGIVLPSSLQLECDSIKAPQEILEALLYETTSATNRIDRHIRGKIEGNTFYFSTNPVDPNLPEPDDSNFGSAILAITSPLLRHSAEGQGYATLRGPSQSANFNILLSRYRLALSVLPSNYGVPI